MHIFNTIGLNINDQKLYFVTDLGISLKDYFYEWSNN